MRTFVGITATSDPDQYELAREASLQEIRSSARRIAAAQSDDAKQSNPIHPKQRTRSRGFPWKLPDDDPDSV